MSQILIGNIAAVVATADKQTATQAKAIFHRARIAPTVGHFKQAFEEVEARREGGDDQGPEVVLLDLDMPDLGFEECLAKLHAGTSDVVTLILSSTRSKVSSALRAGADDYLLKPFRQDDLEMRVQHLLEQHAGARHKRDIPPMDAPLPHLVERLHDPQDGHLDAKRVADFFGVPVAELARVVGRGVSTVHKTPAAPALQAVLRPFEAMASALLRLTGSERRARMWLHAANPALEEHAPIELVRTGKIGDLAAYIQDLLEGRPA